MGARFHIVGCVASTQPSAAIDECIDWLRRQGAEVLAHNDREAVFVKFEAADAELILYATRTAALQRPAELRFGFASGVKEGSGGGPPRVAERGINQACDLAGAAQGGQVLLSSQLGSLLQVARVAPAERLRSTRVQLLSGQKASAYTIDAPRPEASDDESAL